MQFLIMQLLRLILHSNTYSKNKQHLSNCGEATENSDLLWFVSKIIWYAPLSAYLNCYCLLFCGKWKCVSGWASIFEFFVSWFFVSWWYVKMTLNSSSWKNYIQIISYPLISISLEAQSKTSTAPSAINKSSCPLPIAHQNYKTKANILRSYSALPSRLKSNSVSRFFLSAVGSS